MWSEVTLCTEIHLPLPSILPARTTSPLSSHQGIQTTNCLCLSRSSWRRTRQTPRGGRGLAPARPRTERKNEREPGRRGKYQRSTRCIARHVLTMAAAGAEPHLPPRPVSVALPREALGVGRTLVPVRDLPPRRYVVARGSGRPRQHGGGGGRVGRRHGDVGRLLERLDVVWGGAGRRREQEGDERWIV